MSNNCIVPKLRMAQSLTCELTVSSFAKTWAGSVSRVCHPSRMHARSCVRRTALVIFRGGVLGPCLGDGVLMSWYLCLCFLRTFLSRRIQLVYTMHFSSAVMICLVPLRQMRLLVDSMQQVVSLSLGGADLAIFAWSLGYSTASFISKRCLHLGSDMVHVQLALKGEGYREGR